MADTSGSPLSNLFLLLWEISFFYVLWKWAYYQAVGKKRGKEMFGVKNRSIMNLRSQEPTLSKTSNGSEADEKAHKILIDNQGISSRGTKVNNESVILAKILQPTIREVFTNVEQIIPSNKEERITKTGQIASPPEIIALQEELIKKRAIVTIGNPISKQNPKQNEILGNILEEEQSKKNIEEKNKLELPVVEFTPTVPLEITTLSQIKDELDTSENPTLVNLPTRKSWNNESVVDSDFELSDFNESNNEHDRIFEKASNLKEKIILSIAEIIGNRIEDQNELARKKRAIENFIGTRKIENKMDESVTKPIEATKQVPIQDSRVKENYVSLLSLDLPTIHFDTPAKTVEYKIPPNSTPAVKESIRPSVVQPLMKWMGVGSTFSIAQYHIKDGLVYVGKYGSNESYFEKEPSLILNDVNVSQKNLGYISYLNYASPYESLEPNQKSFYLEWLSNGRRGEIRGSGFISLYLSGLERRLLKDLKKIVGGKDEVSHIYDEIKAIHTTYGSDYQINRHCKNLLEVVNFIYNIEPQIIPTLKDFSEYKLPLSIRLELGKLAKAGKAIPAALSMSWISLDPNFYTRTPFERCRKEFESLFQLRYNTKYPNGLTFSRIPKKEVGFIYNFINHSIGSSETIAAKGIPDVSESKQHHERLKVLFEDCTDSLDSYSRYIGRLKDGEESSIAYAYLPDEIFTQFINPSVKTFIDSVNEGLVNNEYFPSEQLNMFSSLGLSPDKLSRKDNVGVLLLLNKAGIGVEPDNRFSKFTIANSKQLIFFKLDKKAEAVPTENYTFAQLFLHLAASLGGRNANQAEYEKGHLRKWILSSKEFSKTEKQRLCAHVEWLFTEKPEINKVKKAVQSLSEEQKSSFINQLIIVAGVDGEVEPEEVKVLQKIYQWMGRDEQQLFSDIHTFQSNDSTNGSSNSFKVKKQDSKHVSSPSIQSDTVILDEKKIRKKQQETRQINALLSTVFAEEVKLPSPKPEKKAKLSKTITGLDAIYSGLVYELVKKTIWSREDFEAICHEKALFADGALEMINEAAFTIANESLLEEDDQITVNFDVAKQMKAL